MNYSAQTYIFGRIPITLKLIKRNYKGYKAKRFTLNGTNQNVWIPNKHLEDDGTIKEGENINYVFYKASRQLEISMQNKKTAHVPVSGSRKRLVK